MPLAEGAGTPGRFPGAGGAGAARQPNEGHSSGQNTRACG